MNRRVAMTILFAFLFLGGCARDEMPEGQSGFVDDGHHPTKDAGPGDGSPFDVAPDDANTNDQGGPMVIGAPCDGPDDCSSGFCIEVDSLTKGCTDQCEEGSCPRGWSCEPAMSPRDGEILLCFPKTAFLCAPCTIDLDCGGTSDLCLDYDDGRFCGRSCYLRECPETFSCVERNAAVIAGLIDSP